MVLRLAIRYAAAGQFPRQSASRADEADSATPAAVRPAGRSPGRCRGRSPWRVLPTSLSGDLAAALCEHGSAAHDENYGHSHQSAQCLFCGVSIVLAASPP
jgi:hypothetical protein